MHFAFFPEIIKKIRKNERKANEIRIFKPPKGLINFEAQCFEDLVDFKHYTSSPPLLQDYSIDEIEAMDFKDEFKLIPLHSQHVERFVYLTTLAHLKSIGYERAHQWILNKQTSTKKYPINSTKKHFIDLIEPSK